MKTQLSSVGLPRHYRHNWGHNVFVLVLLAFIMVVLVFCGCRSIILINTVHMCLSKSCL